MGILLECEQFVRNLPLRPGFSVCELGDQWITHGVHRLAKDLYVELGCGLYVSIDGNGRGTHVADLNSRLRIELPVKQFDLVTDFGTGEHVFNQAQVWRTIHELTKVGGYIAWDRPTQGYVEHGFYNTHECLFHDLAAANEYGIIRIERRKTTRGELIRGVYQKLMDEKFRNPQQGRYRKLLRPIT